MKKNIIIAILGVFSGLFIIFAMVQRNIALENEAESREIQVQAKELAIKLHECQMELEEQRQKTLMAERLAIERTHQLLSK
ncbi:MAG: hypothetical protein HOP30_13220 [Cyclobacteriaceae bacterium]|nr:hypothetical protein [Cyclobacteriaceae bacterium]